jgi:hypothetical protein
MLCWYQPNDGVASGLHVEIGMGRGTVHIFRGLFRGLPPFLRLTTLVGVICGLTCLVLVGLMLITALFPSFAAEGAFARAHLPPLAVSLLTLSYAFSFLSRAYLSHEHSPDTRGFPFHTWQEQARTTALLAALPLCALVLALVPLAPFALISALVGGGAAAVNLWTLLWAASWPVDAPLA